MRTILPYKYFISAELSTESAGHNAKATMELESELRALGLSFTTVTGRYKGTTEESFMVVGSPSVESTIRELASKFGQESYLIVNNENQGFLNDNSGELVKLGQYTETTKEDALKHDSNSEIDGRFFILK
jgi:hypothetical protein